MKKKKGLDKYIGYNTTIVNGSGIAQPVEYEHVELLSNNKHWLEKYEPKENEKIDALKKLKENLNKPQNPIDT